MDPVQQQPSQNPYDFITNPGQPQKAPKLGGSSMRTRILVVLGGLVLLVILVSIGATLLTNAGNADIKAFKDLTAQQQELIRIADLGANKAQSTELRSFAYTTKLSLMTQQQKLISYLDGRGIEVTKIELAAKKSATVDKELETAATNNHFDEVFNETLTEGLVKYANAMKSAYQSAKGDKGKAVLSESYSSSTILLGVKD